LARLERHAGKLARVVLRRLGGSNLARLPGAGMGNLPVYSTANTIGKPERGIQ